MRTLVLLYGTTVAFWSLPMLPGTYSAASPYILLLIGLWASFKVRLSYDQVAWAWAVSVGLLLAHVRSSATIGASLIEVASYIILLLNVLAIFITTRIFGPELLLRSLLVGVYAFVAWGLFDVLSGILSFSHVKISLNQIVSGSPSTRWIATMSETSWAGMFSCFAYAIIFASYRLGIIKRFAFYATSLVLIFFVVYSFSLTAFSIAWLASIVHFWLTKGYRKILLLVTCSALIGGAFLAGFLLFADESSYTYTRVLKIAGLIYEGRLGIYSVLSVDGSLFIRLGYPIAAMKMLAENFWGVGLGSFGIYLSHYLDALSLNYRGLPEVMEHLRLENADTRNFWLKILLDFGVIFGSMIVVPVVLALLSARRSPLIHALSPLLSVALIMTLNFSTVYFSPTVIFIGLCWYLARSTLDPV